MIVDRIEIIPIRVPTRVPMTLSTVTLTSHDNVIVRVWSGGVAGIGEAEPFPGFQGCEESQSSVVQSIRDRLVPVVLGRRTSELVALDEAVTAAAPDAPYARAGVINALHDLLARQLGVPLHALLGGKTRDRLPTVTTLGISDPTRMVREAEAAIGRGYRSLKLKIGAGSVESDAEAVSMVRRSVGPAIGLRVDANAALSRAAARTAVNLLAPVNLDLFEQPLAKEDTHGASHLVADGRIPIMPDESLTNARSALDLILAGAASIFGMKLAKHGGIRQGLVVAAVAQAAGLPIQPGNQPSTSIGSATAAHFFAAQPGATLAGDFNVGPTGWLDDDIVKESLTVVDGAAVVPDGPGIGVELCDKKLARYAVTL